MESLIEQIEISDIDYSKFENDYKIELQTISKNIITKFDNIKEELQLIKDTIVGLKSEYIVSIKNSNWNTDFEKNNIEFNVQKEELEKKGVNDILNFENLKNEKLIIEADLEKIYTEEKLKDKNIIDRSNFQIDYLKKCKEITQKRCDFLNKTFNDSNIKINVKPLRDKLDFENKLRNIINPSDSRGAYINSDIEYLKEISFNGNIEQKIKDFRSVFSSLKKGENVQNITGYFKNLVASLNDAQIDELEILLPEDEIEVQYKPEGSSNFKSLSTASAGQKTTAILTFILSYGNNPLILDQPEDDIDNKHVYELIVERLRQTKEKRQIIVVTHNANIPVNGDAEYIISMNSESKYLEVLHCGTVEQPNIKKEICDVMEGSEKAFIMRSMRYKFIQ